MMLGQMTVQHVRIEERRIGSVARCARSTRESLSTWRTHRVTLWRWILLMSIVIALTTTERRCTVCDDGTERYEQNRKKTVYFARLLEKTEQKQEKLNRYKYNGAPTLGHWDTRFMQRIKAKSGNAPHIAATSGFNKSATPSCSHPDRKPFVNGHTLSTCLSSHGDSCEPVASQYATQNFHFA